MPRILHLEDDPRDAYLIGRHLQAAGLDCQVVVVDEPGAFRAELAGGGYALVISDCGLPGMSARDALGLARASDPDLPFIALSGATRPGAPEELLAAGADDYIIKSDPERLVAAVRRALDVGRSETATSQRQVKAALQLVDAVQKLSLARDLQTVQAIVRRAARELTAADGAAFVLRDGDRCYYADEDAIAPLWKGQRFPMSACVSGWVMTEAEPVVIADIYADSRVPAEAYRPTFVRSMAMVPIRSLAPIGAIGTYWARRHSATREELGVLQALADATAVTMENLEAHAELERRVEARTADLEAANAELESFSYSVSHDLRAPLRTVLGFAALASEALDSGSLGETRDYLARLGAEASRMNRLIESLLALARVTRTAIRRRRVDLTAMARAVLERLARESPDRTVEVTVAEGLVADGDPGLVEDLVENLLSNAWKYTAKTPSARLEFLGETQEDGSTVFVVKDNGAGFDMKHAGRLFRPFQRLHPAGDFPGTGIGLATVKRIVERHGGSVSLESAPDEGTTVRFSLGG